MTRAPITSCAVGIPARDEEHGIGPCVRSVLEAVAATGLRAAVVVAADSCSDHTPEQAASALATAAPHVAVKVIEARWGTAGGARQAACSRAVELLDDELAQVWLATTDADSTVPTSWLADHLRLARDADGVAGLVQLERSAGDRLKGQLDRLQRASGVGDGHPHVHGANLGVRADAWSTVGGFPAVPTGEDNSLWSTLRRHGATLVAVDGERVTTSARLVGRAPAGFASVLTSLAAGD